MKSAAFRRSFFVFLTICLAGVAALLLVIAPARSSQAAAQGDTLAAMDAGYPFIEPASAPPVVEARLLSDDELQPEAQAMAAEEAATDAAASASATAD